MDSGGKRIGVFGMAFGDEGKGAFTDFIAARMRHPLLVKCNGGAQASHTVTLPDGDVFQFSQLSAGMLSSGAMTYLDRGFTMNPFSLAVESEAFAAHIGIAQQDVLDRVIIDENALSVTRLHRTINRVEMALSGSLRGSVGTGVSTAAITAQRYGIRLPFRDVVNGNRTPALLELQKFLREQTRGAVIPDDRLKCEVLRALSPEAIDEYELEYAALLAACRFHMESIDCSAVAGDVLFEGSQGLLLDERYGTKPYTTHLNTTSEMARGIPGCIVLGAIRAICTRHGPGPFPTFDPMLERRLTDVNQENGRYNGRIRFGWADMVLLRYAARVNRPHALLLSCMDALTGVHPLKLCVGYALPRSETSGAAEFIACDVTKDELIVRDVMRLDEKVLKLLQACAPVYREFDGWDEPIDTACDLKELPAGAVEFIRAIEKECGIPIAGISVGPTRAQKFLMGGDIDCPTCI